MNSRTPSPPLRLEASYEETILTLTDAEAHLALRLEPVDFWAWFEQKAAGAEPAPSPRGVRT